MRRRLAAGLLALPLVALASCDDPTDPTTDATCGELRNDPRTADVFEWLAAPSGAPKDLGGMTADQALALARKFEARGARRLLAVGNTATRSRGLLIELPDDPTARLAIFQLYADQVRNRGLAPQTDHGQKYLLVPWGLGPRAERP
jgi:hypothetical protein